MSLDNVLAPIDGGNSPTQVRADAAAEGRTSNGPAGYREAGCATVAFCDAKGDLLGAIRMARAPESKKATLEKMLADGVSAVLAKKPNIKLVKVADGATDNWEFLSSSALPAGEEALDFFRAGESLHVAIAAAYGDGTHETRFRYDTTPRHAARRTRRRRQGHSCAQAPRGEASAEEVDRRGACVLPKEPPAACVTPSLKAQGLMIGSGIVEAACKTLVAQRLKQSGMRRSSAGAQAVLTPRGRDRSDRFDEAWALIAASFHAEVTVLANVIAFKPKPADRAKKKPTRAASR